MQVARLLDPHPRTFGGKFRQLWRALQLEWHLSKREIRHPLPQSCPFGGTLQGVGAASWAYLGKPPAQLSYADAALLASAAAGSQSFTPGSLAGTRAGGTQ